jgi:hypothetical protein
MRYALEYESIWTVFTVGFYARVEECELHCTERYGVDVKFKPDENGVLTATLYADDSVTLTLYEVKEAVL